VAPVRSTRLPPDERREQLVRMGVQLLGGRAYQPMSIGDLARAAGISKGLLYHYFPTKSEFVVAVLREARHELERRMVPDPALPPAERLDASIAAFLSYVDERAAGYLAVVRARGGDDEAIRAELLEGRRRRVSGLVDFASALSGTPRAELESPALDAALEGWLSCCEGVVVRWLAERDLTREDVLHLLRQALLGALESVAGVDDRPAAARLAAAAGRAAKTRVLSAT
jgi:AcrR family transcriptional regulator